MATMVQPIQGTVNDITMGSATGAVDTHTYQTACIQCRTKHCAEYGDNHEDERRVKFFQKPFLKSSPEKKQHREETARGAGSPAKPALPYHCSCHKPLTPNPSTLHRTCEQAPATGTAPHACTRLVHQQSQDPSTTKLVLNDQQV